MSYGEGVIVLKIPLSSSSDLTLCHLFLLLHNLEMLVKFGSIFTARRYASAVLAIEKLSVRLSVRLPHACFMTKPGNPLAIFLHHMKGQSL